MLLCCLVPSRMLVHEPNRLPMRQPRPLGLVVWFSLASLEGIQGFLWDATHLDAGEGTVEMLEGFRGVRGGVGAGLAFKPPCTVMVGHRQIESECVGLLRPKSPLKAKGDLG